MAEDITTLKSAPITEGTPPLTQEEVAAYQEQLTTPWKAEGAARIEQTFSFTDFVEAVAFVNRVAELAEDEQHHPDIHLVGYNTVTIELSTHSVKGLSVNDFIVARKIEDLVQ